MRQIHFIVSIKTVDNTPLFPSDFNGESFLLETTIKVSTQVKILTKGYSSFPTGLEAIICCSNISEAKKYADEICMSIYQIRNTLGSYLDSLGIQIGEIKDNKKSLESAMMDMMIRGMKARGLDFNSIPTINIDLDKMMS